MLNGFVICFYFVTLSTYSKRLSFPRGLSRQSPNELSWSVLNTLRINGIPMYLNALLDLYSFYANIPNTFVYDCLKIPFRNLTMFCNVPDCVFSVFYQNSYETHSKKQYVYSMQRFRMFQSSYSYSENNAFNTFMFYLKSVHGGYCCMGKFKIKTLSSCNGGH